MRFGLIAIFALLMTPFAVQAAEPVERQVQVYFFWTRDCPGCDAGYAFLHRARMADPAIRLRDFDVEASLANATLLAKVYERVGLSGFLVVPLLIIGTKLMIGFDDEAGPEILKHINECQQRDCRDIVHDLIKKPSESEQAILR